MVSMQKADFDVFDPSSLECWKSRGCSHLYASKFLASLYELVTTRHFFRCGRPSLSTSPNAAIRFCNIKVAFDEELYQLWQIPTSTTTGPLKSHMAAVFQNFLCTPYEILSDLSGLSPGRFQPANKAFSYARFVDLLPCAPRATRDAGP